MTQETKQKVHKKERIELGFGISSTEWFISSVIGTVSGIVAAAAKVRDLFSDEITKWPGFKDRYEQHGRDLDAINIKHKNLKSDWKLLRDEISEAKENFATTKANHLLSDHGIHTKGVKGLTLGTWQRYGFAGKSSQGRIAFNTIVGATIGAAATLSFFNGVASRHKIERIEDAVTSKNSSEASR